MQVGHKGNKHQGFLQKLNIHSFGWKAHALGLQRSCSLIEQKILQRRISMFEKIITFAFQFFDQIKKFNCYLAVCKQFSICAIQNSNLIFEINSILLICRDKEMIDQQEQSSEEKYYQVERILDVKEQNGKKYYLVKWLGWDIKTCTWELQSNISHLKQLIKQFTNSRKYDQQNDLQVKKLDIVLAGMSPYQQTKVHGHVLYGDQPRRILQVSVIEKNNKKTAHFLIQWEARDNNYQPFTSLIESSILMEHYPLFVAQFYQSKISLVPKH